MKGKPMSDGIPAARRKWHVTVELSNGQVEHKSVISPDLVGWVRKKRTEYAARGIPRALAPLPPWVIEYVLEDCGKMLNDVFKNEEATPTVMNVRISKVTRNEEAG